MGEQADEHPLEHRVLTGDHAPDLEQGLLQPILDRVRAQLLTRHLVLLRWGLPGIVA